MTGAEKVAPLYFDDFVRALESATTLDASKQVLQRSIEALGFVSFDYGHGFLKRPSPISTEDAVFQLHLSTFDWAEYYISQGYQHVDRATLTSLTRATPWLYWDVIGREPENDLQRRMENDVLERVSSGLAIPVHGVGLRFGQMHLGSQLPRTEFERLDREIRPIAALIAAYFHEHVRKLLGRENGAPDLSERERECLLWASRGKTAWEIAAILSISERTARAHIGAALRKLDVRTRTQAVARAIATGLISP